MYTNYRDKGTEQSELPTHYAVSKFPLCLSQFTYTWLSLVYFSINFKNFWTMVYPDPV